MIVAFENLKPERLKLRQAVQGALRRRWTFSLMLSISLVPQCILPKNWPFLRSGTNDHTVQCLTEMLFLDSMLMIIIVTNLAWEPIPQDLYPWWHSKSIILPRDFAWNPFSLVNLVPKLSQDDALGKGLVELLTTWGISLFSAASWKVYKILIK